MCVEDDYDLRVDCLTTPTPNQINSYEFSWSSGTTESLINTNVSGSAAEGQFKDKSYVEELEPHGYRMTLNGFTDKLPHNTTYMCKISGKAAAVNVMKGGWSVSVPQRQWAWEWVSGRLVTEHFDNYLRHAFLPLQINLSRVQRWACFCRAPAPGSFVSCSSSIKHTAKNEGVQTRAGLPMSNHASVEIKHQ